MLHSQRKYSLHKYNKYSNIDKYNKYIYFLFFAPLYIKELLLIAEPSITVMQNSSMNDSICLRSSTPHPS